VIRCIKALEAESNVPEFLTEDDIKARRVKRDLMTFHEDRIIRILRG
jgi:hypothetical protein